MSIEFLDYVCRRYGVELSERSRFFWKHVKDLNKNSKEDVVDKLQLGKKFDSVEKIEEIRSNLIYGARDLRLGPIEARILDFYRMFVHVWANMYVQAAMTAFLSS